MWSVESLKASCLVLHGDGPSQPVYGGMEGALRPWGGGVRGLLLGVRVRPRRDERRGGMGSGENPGPEFPAWPTLAAMSALKRSRGSLRSAGLGKLGWARGSFW